MNSKLSLILAAGGLIVMTGCGSKKLAQPKAEYFTLNPSPLEVVGENVPGNVQGKFPGSYFVKNAELTVTPVLSFDGKELKGLPVTVQGEKVRANNPVINFEYGGSMTVPVNYTFEPGMEDATVSLNFTAKQGNKTYALAPVTIGKGILTTAALATATDVQPALAADKFQKVINEKYEADIMFLINQANIRDSELRSAQMKEFNAEVLKASQDSSRRIEEINISSYASPDGGVEFNEKLAANREKNTSAYIKDKLKKDKITEFGELTAQFTAQDWDGFQKLVSQSNIQDKELILSVLSMYKDPVEREREIRNLSSIFDQLAEEILPQLRYSRLTATVSVIGKSDDEIKNLLATNPSALSVDEILYAATLTDDNAKRMSIYNTAARLYPNDYRTYNNLGATQLAAGDYRAAKSNFEQAARLTPGNPESEMNLGVLDMINGDYSAANSKLGQAAGAAQLPDALGTYNLLQGNTAAAVNAFGDTKSNNAAIAQILNKDYAKAKSTLSGIVNPDETTYYLMAIVGARTNNDQMVKTNLRQATRMNSKLADRARNDVEFSRYDLSGIL